MECQDVRLLLAFVDRRCEELDETERGALKQHLEMCPVCAEMAHADRRVDEVLGAALRDVPVPAGLKHKVLRRLASERGSAGWRWGLAAAVGVIAIAMGTLLYYYQAPQVTRADLEQMASDGSIDPDVVLAGNRGLKPSEVERRLADKGLAVTVPDFFDYQFLQDFDVVEFRGKRVAKLTFASDRTSASVLILAPSDFGLRELKDGLLIPGTTSVQIYHSGGFVNVVFFRGGPLGALYGSQAPQN